MSTSPLLSLVLPLTAAFSPAFKTAVASSYRATPISAKLDEAAAKAAWLAKLDTPDFGARTTLTDNTRIEATTNVKTIQVNVDEATAKAAWLAKLDQPKLGVKSEAAAKAAWLAKIEHD